MRTTPIRHKNHVTQGNKNKGAHANERDARNQSEST